MRLRIVKYGHPVLKKKSEELSAQHPNLPALIDDMFETMYFAKGVGLAANQIGKAYRLFVVDASGFSEDIEDENLKNFKQVFINPQIVEESGEEWIFNEGCLSVPDVRVDVKRKSEVKIAYYDRDFNRIEETYDGIIARIIQHEYDHIEGILMTDRISPLKLRLIQRKLKAIAASK